MVRAWKWHLSLVKTGEIPPFVCAPRRRYLGTAPGGTGALAANTHAEALEAAIRVVSAQVEGAGGTLVAQASHNVVLQAQSWELQDGPQEGLPGALGFSHPPSRQGA